MFALLKKEVGSFLYSLIGYIVIIVFLLGLSLFLWIFPGDSNILDSGYAGLDGLFVTAPWMFLFLVPAITMRSFSEEKRIGTIELLYTKPLSNLQIITAKYLAGLLLVLLSLIPTLVYFYSIYQLGNPIGNIDTGGTWGSYIGLFFLGAAFVSIGIFSSSLTDNQIISFIVSFSLCFLCYTGFDSISGLPMIEGWDHLIISLGIQEHYISMSRGIIDTRDILYFVSIIAFFLLLTRSIISRRDNT